MSAAPEAFPASSTAYEHLQNTQLTIRIAQIEHLKRLVNNHGLPRGLVTPQLINEQQGLQAELDSRATEPEDTSRLYALIEANQSTFGPLTSSTPKAITKISSSARQRSF